MDARAETRAPARASSKLAVQVVCGLLVALAAGVGVGFGAHALSARSAPASAVNVTTHFGMHGEAGWAAGTQPAPAITTLHDQSGHPFSLASLRGHTVAIVFFDSHCTQACPLEGRAFASTERSLPAAQRPVLVAVSVNPADTPASVRKAARSWGLAGIAPWHWLMGTRKQLAPVWAAYHIFVSPHPINGDIAHTEGIYLVDHRGYERSAYLWPFASRFVTMDLRTLGRGANA